MTETCLSLPTMVRVMFRKADGPGSPKIYTGAMPSITAGLREEMLNSAARPDLVLRFLAEMDRKLDAILAFMRRETLQADFPCEGFAVELSGTGLILECEKTLKEADNLEILLLLEEYPMRVVSAMSRVESLADRPALTGQGRKAYAASFGAIEEDDREHLIRFLFSEQRKRIRRERGEI
ncbi:MAG: hypothetical protein LBH65_05665 [Desulfovibrio sp.]|jgi:hypothetical protein|nr:hypothetical protein [Desulfovibrio sp.]